jgi:membrane protein
MGRDAAAKLKQIHNATRDFLEEKGIESADRFQSAWWRRACHFWLMVVKSFWRNRCPVRASALAYTTLLALIPVLAIAVSVTTSLLQSRGEKPIRELIDYLVVNVAPALSLEMRQGDAAAASKRDEVVTKITEFIGNIRSGTLGLTSTIALVFVAISLLRTIEAAFNDIWGVHRGRGWLRSSIQYWTAITLGPVILVLAVGLTTSSQFAYTTRWLTRLGWLGTFALQLLPFAVVSVAFGLFYQLMPNTRVRWRAAFAGGLVGGCLWQLNNLFNVLYVSRVITYSKIYGSLGMIPLFLVGLYFSWLIVLFGAQVAYAAQNRQAYLEGRLAEGVNQRGREFIGLRLMTLVADRFHRAHAPLAASQLAAALDVPMRLVSQILQSLVQASLVLEVNERETAYVPARPLEQINLHHILEALRASQGIEPATREDRLRALVRAECDRVRQAEEQAATAVTLRDLVALQSEQVPSENPAAANRPPVAPAVPGSGSGPGA